MIRNQDQDSTEELGKHHLRIWIKELDFRGLGILVTFLTFAFIEYKQKVTPNPNMWGIPQPRYVVNEEVSI